LRKLLLRLLFWPCNGICQCLCRSLHTGRLCCF